jgi:uncharacterized membrane protein
MPAARGIFIENVGVVGVSAVGGRAAQINKMADTCGKQSVENVLAAFNVDFVFLLRVMVWIEDPRQMNDSIDSMLAQDVDEFG